MFLPPGPPDSAAPGGLHSAANQKRAALDRVEGWCLARIPPELVSLASVHVREVQCGDPSCSPIDTSIMIMFNASGGTGTFGLPMEAHNITEDDLDDVFPTEEYLPNWGGGGREEWNPYAGGEEDDMFDDEDGMDEDEAGNDEPFVPPPGVTLRFNVGDEVQCRIGEDPVTGWGDGVVILLWYREKGWPPGQMAPYKIRLSDNRNIFAPSDIPEVIRKRPTL